MSVRRRSRASGELAMGSSSISSSALRCDAIQAPHSVRVAGLLAIARASYPGAPLQSSVGHYLKAGAEKSRRQLRSCCRFRTALSLAPAPHDRPRRPCCPVQIESPPAPESHARGPPHRLACWSRHEQVQVLPRQVAARYAARTHGRYHLKLRTLSRETDAAREGQNARHGTTGGRWRRPDYTYARAPPHRGGGGELAPQG